jgi:hypothetical protein
MLRIGFGEAEAGVGVAPKKAPLWFTPTRPAFAPSELRRATRIRAPLESTPQVGGIRKSCGNRSHSICNRPGRGGIAVDVNRFDELGASARLNENIGKTDQGIWEQVG